MTDPDRDRRERSISRMSWIAFILAFLVLLLGVVYNRPAPGADGATDIMTRSI